MKKIIYTKTGSKALSIKGFGIPKLSFRKFIFWKGLLRKNKQATALFIILLSIFASLYVMNALRPDKGDAAWWNDNWAYRKTITINNSVVDSDLTDFPVLVKFTSSELTFSKAKSNGEDIRFTDQNGNLLSYEIERWDSQNSLAEVWVKLPIIYSETDTNFYIYYGNPQAQDTQKTKDVWSNGYSHVYHTNTSTKNSVNNDTSAVFGANGVDGAGKIAQGRVKQSDFSTQLLTVSEDRPSATALTVETWHRPDTFQNWNDILAQGWVGNGWNLLTNSTGAVLWGVALASTQSNVTGATLTDGVWAYLAGTYNGTTSTLYVNGASSGTPTSPSGYATDTTSNINSLPSGDRGSVDEIRISTVSRSAAWIKASYNSSNNTLVSLSSEEKSPAPLSYWSFDEGTGTVANDGGINHYNGTLSGATWSTENMCVSGKCLSFDGSASYVNVGDKYDFTNNTPFSFSVWVNPVDISTSVWRRIISKEVTDGSGRQGIILYQNKDTSQIVIEMWKDGTSKSASTASIPLSSWTYITATYDGTNMRIYQNGILKGTTASSLSLSDTSANFVFGRYSSGGSLFKGKLDEPKIYDYALTDAQIKANYNTRGSELGSTAVLGAYDDENLSNGLLGYWKMDEASWTNDCSTTSVTDSSGNGNNGTSCPNGTGISTLSNGKFGNAPSFDGSNDYVSVSSSTYNLTNNFTLSAWVNPNTDSDTNYGLISSAAYATTNQDWWLHRRRSGLSNQLSFQALNGSQVSSTNAVTANTWSHVVFTLNNGVARLYINGVLDGENTSFGALSSGNTGIIIGKRADTSVTNGEIDEARIYNRPLSGQEVAQLYNWAAGPVAYYNFEEGNGTAVNDTSGYGNTATINGTTYRWGSGRYGKSLYTLPNTYTSTPNSNSINLGSLMTVSFWMKSPVQTDYQFLMQKGITANGTRWSIQTSGSAAGIAAKRVYLRLDTSGGANQSGCNVDNVTDNSWHHVAFTINNGSVDCYRDGAKVDSYSYTIGNGFADPTQPLVMWSGVGSGTHLDSNLDDVRIYNYPQTAGQVVSDMNGGHPGVGSPVASAVGHWKFDEATGTSTANSGNSGSTYNGTLSGTTWSTEGKYKNAIRQTGTNTVTIPDGAGALDFGTNDFTISAWIKTSSTTDNRNFINKGAGAGISGWRFGLASGRPHVLIGDTVGPTEGYVGPTSIADNAWHLVTVVFDRDTGAIGYVDGRATGTVLNITSRNGSVDNSSAILVTANTYGGFTGAVDDIKMYNYALTANEARLEYNQGKSIAFGALSDTSGLAGGSVASNSASAEYCVPGDTTSCTAPLGRWDFEEGQGTNVNDSSANGNAGTFSGSSSYWGSGKVGKGGKFNGSDNQVSMGDDTDFEFTSGQSFTVQAWVNSSYTPAVSQGILTKGYETTTQAAPWYLLELRPNVAVFELRNTALGTKTMTGTTIINDGKWHHLVGVVDSTNGYLYVDGKLEGTATSIVSDTYGNNASSFIVGRRFDRYFNGYIDNIRVFNYARTPAQVAWDYNRGAPAGYWKLDECQGTTANDASGNRNNGTITIGATGSQTTIGTCTTPTDGTGAWYNGRIGKYNSSMSFDGTDDNISIGDISALEGLSSVSIAAWINPASLSGSRDIIQKENTYNFRMSGSTVQCWIHNGSSFVNIANATLPTSTGTWAHVACTWTSGSAGKIYINGKDATSSSTSGSAMTSTANAFTIGSRNGTSEFFSGQIDDARIYNYTLTGSQVKQVYNQGAAVRFGPNIGTP